MRLLVFPIAVAALGLAAASSPAAAQGPGKVFVCHRNGNGALRPISISASALPAHLAHGDVQQNDLVAGGGGAYNASCGVVGWGYDVNTAPDDAAIDPLSPGNLFVGSGIPAKDFGTARNESAGIELGLMVLYRQGPTVPSADDYDDGVLEFSVAEGPQSTANGSSGNNAARAAWNFTYSVATGLNGATTDLTDFTVQLLYDVDPSAGVEYRTLTLEPWPGPPSPPASGFLWRDEGTTLVFIADDEGNASVTQNSENYAFGFFQVFLTSAYGPGNAFAGPAEFEVVLRAFDGAQLIAQNHIRLNVESAP